MVDEERAISESKVEPALDFPHYFPNSRKRTFVELRLRILITLTKGDRTINDLAVRSGINWRTVDLHLTHLLGKRLVEEIFSSQYVRIFTITPKGREFLQQAQFRIQQQLEVPQ